MRYPGGKGGDGVWQRIVNQMPPHEVYIEPFVGGGAVLRHKRPARRNLVADADPAVRAFWRAVAAAGWPAPGALEVAGHDALHLLAQAGRQLAGPAPVMVYCDPPYVLSTRTRRRVYAREMTDGDHRALLALLRRLPFHVAVSGYRCPLYDRALAGWRRIDYTAATRGGPRPESLWLNYAAPQALHDASQIGDDYRERERIRKKARRWAANLAAMPPLERQAVLSAMLGGDGPAAPPLPAVVDRLAGDRLSPSPAVPDPASP